MNYISLDNIIKQMTLQIVNYPVSIVVGKYFSFKHKSYLCVFTHNLQTHHVVLQFGSIIFQMGFRWFCIYNISSDGMHIKVISDHW